MFFPASGIEVSPFVPPLAAFVVAFFSSMGGISGAFLLLPFQLSVLGCSSVSASATNHCFNVFASPGGVIRYAMEKRMVWPLALLVAAGTLPGVFAGAMVRVTFLPDPGTFRLFAGAVLLYIGSRLLKVKEKPKAKGAGAFQVEVTERSLRRISYTFEGETYTCPVPALLMVSFLIGIVGGAYGIGGGAIIGPLLISFFRLPVHTIGGVTLASTFLTSVAGVVFYSLIAPFYPEQAVSPDWMLAFLFGAGGFAGMYAGARFQKHMPAGLIRRGLCFVILATAVSYFAAFAASL
ncbi:MAG: sulfite exporter TauE/SafE family protein [Mailhella sp.]|nr:sulfite exporter TauE/SafE family protein [Mailhella sp.]